ncbi:MAG: plastocyanin/azurin family copper-binding protein [Candidatus Scalinduaceae bacterium]
MMKKVVFISNIVVLLIIFSFYGCGIADQTNSDSSTTPSPGATTHTVEMRSYEFVPSSLTINQGDSVKWVLIEDYHSSTSGTDGEPDGIWDSTTLMRGSFTYTFNSTGTFPYFCSTHFEVGMTGTITVK